MLREQLHRKLLVAARSRPVDEGVPYGFERRIMAALRSQLPADPWQVCNRVLWRAAALGVAITMLSGGWAYYATVRSVEPVDLEHTLLATVEHPGEVW